LPDTGNILPPAQPEVLPQILPAVLLPTLARAALPRAIAVPEIVSDAAPVTGPEIPAVKPAPLTLPCVLVLKAKARPGSRSDPAPDAKLAEKAAGLAPPTALDAPALPATAPPSPFPQHVAAVETAAVELGSATPVPPVQSGIQPVLIPAELVVSPPVPPPAQPVFARAEPSEAAGRPIMPQTPQPGYQPPVQTRPAISPAPLPPQPLSGPALPVLPIAGATTLQAASVAAEPLTRAPPTMRIRAASAATAAPIALADKSGNGLALVFEPRRDKAALVPILPEGTAAPSGGAQAAEPVGAAPTIAPIRSLDFAALVDRLVQARDAAAPQTVSLALNHAEFGKISLRFEQDDTGLSVGMTSPDPDFARAVSAAIPTDRAAQAEPQTGSAQSSGQGQSARHDTATGDLPGQSRSGPNSERRDERGPARPDPARPSRDTADKLGRDGIFA
jgi:hypothetical protein